MKLYKCTKIISAKLIGMEQSDATKTIKDNCEKILKKSEQRKFYKGSIKII